MVLPGFHEIEKPIYIIVKNDVTAGWHYYDANDKKILIEQKALTCRFQRFYLKLSESEDVVGKKEGVELLKGMLAVKVTDLEGNAHAYTLVAGLDTAFFRSLLISMEAIALGDLGRDWTVEVEIGDRGCLANIRDSKTKELVRGKPYGKKWVGLDYPALLFSTLNRLDSSESRESRALLNEVLGRADVEPVRVLPAPQPTKPKNPGLYPQHTAIANKVISGTGMAFKDARFIAQNAFSGEPPDNLDPQQFANFIEHLLVSHYKTSYASPELLLTSWRSKLAFYQGDYAAAILSWTKAPELDDDNDF